VILTLFAAGVGVGVGAFLSRRPFEPHSRDEPFSQSKAKQGKAAITFNPIQSNPIRSDPIRVCSISSCVQQYLIVDQTNKRSNHKRNRNRIRKRSCRVLVPIQSNPIQCYWLLHSIRSDPIRVCSISTWLCRKDQRIRIDRIPNDIEIEETHIEKRSCCGSRGDVRGAMFSYAPCVVSPRPSFPRSILYTLLSKDRTCTSTISCMNSYLAAKRVSCITRRVISHHPPSTIQPRASCILTRVVFSRSTRKEWPMSMS
jgi:hypothetical protein